MNIDVPPWLSHREESVFSIDVDSKGRRVATAGSDAQVKVWSVPPLLSAAAEQDENQFPRLLATITEHCAPVNTVRFSGTGSMLATCSDDRQSYIFELRPGTGTGTSLFGSTDKSSLENWKLLFPLRGHSNNVIDVAWSPDDSQLATCSLDNRIIIWSSQGRQVALLEGHLSYVKGVAWDPIGTYLASQSDDKSIIIWRCSDWTITRRIDAPFKTGFISQTFSLRLSWTTDGQFVVGMNSFQSPLHCACVLTRGDWDAALSVVGHQAAVTVVRFNPLLFEDPTGDSDPTNCFALGSQDSKVTVWLSSGDRPIIILSKVFSQSVCDLAWTPDGHTLLASSTDGRVAVFRFERGSLGVPVPKAAKEAYLRRLYGDQPAARVLLPESASHLGPELRDLEPGQPDSNASVPTPPVSTHLPPRAPVPRIEVQAPGGAVRIGPSQHERPINNVTHQLAAPAPNTIPSQLMDARLTARNATAGTASGPSGPVRTSGPSSLNSKGPQQQGAGPNTGRRLTPEQMGGSSGAMQRNPVLPNLAGPSSVAGQAFWRPQAAPKSRSVHLGTEELPGTQGMSLDLQFRNTNSGAEVFCTRAATVVWKDRLRSMVVKAEGNTNFAVLALQDGSVQIYTAAGRQLLPSLALGSPAMHLCAGLGWQLLVVCPNKSLRLWDLQLQQLIIKTSLSCFQGSPEVVAIRLSESGSPLIFLADGTAYMLHLKLQEWLCIANHISASSFESAAPSSSGPGELAKIQSEAAAAAAASGHRAGRENPATASATNDSRRQLEFQIAASLALGSAQDYRRWVLSYVRHLAGNSEEGALREICSGLLGPVRRTGEAGSRTVWEPLVLGIDKRALLKELLREISRHRTHQRLLAELQDHLKAAEEVAMQE